jgi:hypothetical protein
MILQIFYITFVLFIWFETDAFISYSKLLRLSHFFKIDKWEEYKILKNPKIDYLSYIRNDRNNFFTKIISCKPCFNFWIVLISCIIFGNWIYFPLIYILSYLIYNILWKSQKY